MAEINLEQEVDALTRNLETAEAQRDKLLDLLDDILTGNFLDLGRLAVEAATTVKHMKRSQR